ARALGLLTAVSESESAYYFRYVEPRLREPGHAAQLLELELDLIELGPIDALGERFVAEDC
ncbi:MAG: hypothetical protein ABIS23_03420, partial [Sphingomicrobium sp.]